MHVSCTAARAGGPFAATFHGAWGVLQCTALVRAPGPGPAQPAHRTCLGRNTLMSLALVQSRALLGLQAPPVTVEVHLANGLPSFTMVGL